MEAQRWVGKWQGGRVREGVRGRTWMIEKTIDGRRYVKALKVDSEKGALAELALFERDPDAYVVSSSEEAITLDSERVAAFLKHLEARKLAPNYREDVGRYLEAWRVWFNGRDLRRVQPRELLRYLDSPDAPGARSMIVALKSFTKWLRNRAELDLFDDPTRQLKVPKAVPEKSVHAKGYPAATIGAVYAQIAQQDIRDAVCVAALTGLHSTEIDRLARGEGAIEPLNDQGEIAGQLRVWHKNGREHRQSVPVSVLAALLRLKERGQLPSRQWLRKCLRKASAAAGVESLDLGALRHSFITIAGESGSVVWPRSGGVPASIIAQVVGHDVRTNGTYYRSGLEPLIKLPIQLRHAEDPES